MKWHFPLTRFAKEYDTTKQIDSIVSELTEFKRATSLDEKASDIMDILQSAETLVRMFFLKYPSVSFHREKTEKIRKNRKRGYYK